MDLFTHGRRFTLATGHRDDERLRAGFNQLTQMVYGFDFAHWHQLGYWSECYQPYSLCCGDVVAANVSVNRMEFLLDGQMHAFVQLGTVMTHPEYRGMGLSRWLMERVLDQWRENCELVYLFANDSVLDFYPKFGFRAAQELEHQLALAPAALPAAGVRSLHPEEPSDRQLAERLCAESLAQARLSLRHNPGLALFYLTGFLSDCVYYLEDLDALAVAQWEGETLVLVDLFCPHPVQPRAVVERLARPETRKVRFGFTPLDTAQMEGTLLNEPDCTLFTLPGRSAPPDLRGMRFPELSHA